jgi:hypothetical protein
MKQETLKTFIDVPEKITQIQVVESAEKVRILWKEPENNNSKTKEYRIYLKQGNDFKKIGISTEPEFDLEGLSFGSASHVMVTAVNEYGEGYKPDTGSVVLT